LLLTLPALPPACDRHAELRTPELADLHEAARTDGAGISRAESAIRRWDWIALLLHYVINPARRLTTNNR
jgi:hypothetical protein